MSMVIINTNHQDWSNKSKAVGHIGIYTKTIILLQFQEKKACLEKCFPFNARVPVTVL